MGWGGGGVEKKEGKVDRSTGALLCAKHKERSGRIFMRF